MSARWHFRTFDENCGPDGQPREVYRPLFARIGDMADSQLRSLDSRL